jgi:iron complex transport system substrate-binding protein
LLDKEEDSGEIIAFIKKYQDIIDERTAGLKDDDKPSVFFEWSKPYRSMASGVYHNLTVEAGGINIVSDQPVQSPTMDPEWIVERDPDIIVRSVSVTDKENLSEKLVETRNEIISRPELSDVVAIKEDHVCALGAPILSGIRSLVGELYLAKWFHPDLFEDIDPEDVHRELLDKFFDQELEEVYVYP